MRGLLLFLLLTTTSLAQGQLSWKFFNNEGYVAGQTDTSKVFTIKANSDASLFFSFNDSANVGIFVDYTSSSGKYATYTVTDSTNNATDGGFGVGYILRRGGTDNIPGGTQIRVRAVARSTKNGVSSATFNAFLLWRDD